MDKIQECKNNIRHAIGMLEKAILHADVVELDMEGLEDYKEDMQGWYAEEAQFPYSSNVDQMKVDILKEHWDKITLDHIDNMVKYL